jgi:hypothetical protein
MALAPFKDPAWAIWACSPGAYPICAQNRSDVWFEVHRWQPTPPGKFGSPGTKPWFSPEFHTFLSQHKGPVYMAAVDPTIPQSVRIPFEMLREKHGPYLWQSTMSYMLALAIEELAPRAAAGEQVSIGLWGVDMCASEEWAYQRPACQHFIGLAKSLGINIVLPEESDLMRPPTMYGVGELSPRHIRVTAMLAEARAVKAQADQQVANGQHVAAITQGRIAVLEYMLATWMDDVDVDPSQAISFSGLYAKPVGSMLAANTTSDAAMVAAEKAMAAEAAERAGVLSQHYQRNVSDHTDDLVASA